MRQAAIEAYERLPPSYLITKLIFLWLGNWLHPLSRETGTGEIDCTSSRSSTPRPNCSLNTECLIQRTRSSSSPLHTSDGSEEAESRPDIHDMRRRWWHRCKLHSPNSSNTSFYPTLQDLAVYKILGSLERLEIAEVCARSGSTCGSIFLDLRFRELIEGLLERHPKHLNPLSLAAFMDAFSETDKLAFRGEADDENMFHFTCFETDDTCASHTLSRIYDPSHCTVM